MQIESNLYQHQGSAITNFERALPPAQADLARQIKDPYNFDFLTLTQDAQDEPRKVGKCRPTLHKLLENPKTDWHL